MPCWWNRDWFRGQENKPQLVASVQRECASPTLGALPQWLKGSIRSVLRREKASNSVSPLSLKSLQWLMPHTPSPISHVVSFHIRSHRPCWRNITLWYSRTVATSIRSNLSQSGCWKKQFHLLVQKMATSVLVLTTLSSNSSLFLLKGWKHLQAKWRGKYQSKGIKTKTKTPKKKPPKTSLDFTCLLVLSYSTVKSKYVPWKYNPMLTLTCKRAHVSRLHTAQIALFSTLLVLY